MDRGPDMARDDAYVLLWRFSNISKSQNDSKFNTCNSASIETYTGQLYRCVYSFDAELFHLEVVLKIICSNPIISEIKEHHSTNSSHCASLGWICSLFRQWSIVLQREILPKCAPWKNILSGEAQEHLWFLLILFTSSVFEFSSTQKEESSSTISSIHPKNIFSKGW